MFLNVNLGFPNARQKEESDDNAVKIMRKLYEEISYGNRTTKEVIYVIDGLQNCLLGKPAIVAFGLSPNILNICFVNPTKDYPWLFQGLGL